MPIMSEKRQNQHKKKYESSGATIGNLLMIAQAKSKNKMKRLYGWVGKKNNLI